MDKDYIINILENNTNWDGLCKSGNLTEEFILKYIDRMKSKILFQYQQFSEDTLDTLVDAYGDDVDWRAISKYQKLSEDFIREHVNEVDWNDISKFQKLSNNFINEFNYRVNWKYISAFQNMCLKFATKYRNRIDWFNACFNEHLSEEVLSIGKADILPYLPGNNYLFPRDIYSSKNGTLTITALRLFKDKLNWDSICYHNRKLSEDVIREFHNEVDWTIISRYYDLSESFIREFKDYVVWQDISTYQVLSEEFITEFKDKLAA